MDSKADRKMDDLQNEFDYLKPIMNGKGRAIALRAGVHYSTYCNYISGFSSNPETMQKIIDSTKAIVREKNELENSLIS